MKRNSSYQNGHPTTFDERIGPVALETSRNIHFILKFLFLRYVTERTCNPVIPVAA